MPLGLVIFIQRFCVCSCEYMAEDRSRGEHAESEKEAVTGAEHLEEGIGPQVVHQSVSHHD